MMTFRRLVVGATLLVTGAASAQVLTHEPPFGAIPTGTKVLVDDGSCPHGKIKEVTGGVRGSTGGRGTGGNAPRTRRCIAR